MQILAYPPPLLLPLSPSSLRLLPSHNLPIFASFRRKGKRKGRKKKKRILLPICCLPSPLPFCFFSLPLPRKKARNPVFTRVERGGRKKEEEDLTCHHNLLRGQQDYEVFLYFFCSKNSEKCWFYGVWGGWRGWERGKKRTPWTNPQGPVIGYFILFSEKIKFCQLNDRLQRSHRLSWQKKFFLIIKV